MMGEISFAWPPVLLLLAVIPLMAWAEKRGKKGSAALRLSNASGVAHTSPSLKVRLRPLLPLLRYLGFAALIIALARPQRHHVQEYIESEGIDIVLALDVSGSMLAEDLKPNRLEAAKDVALRFVDARPADRIGLVIFSGESFSQCPATIDHRAVREALMQLRIGLLEDGTAIGDGLATAVDRVRSGGKSRIVVLMTDGVNNREHVSPGTALDIAKTFGVKVYTIGIGTMGEALYPDQTPFGVEKRMVPVQIDEPLLKRIAAETKGKYFRATDNASLQAIYSDIDRLEKRKIESTVEEQNFELYGPLALTALICLVAELLLRLTILKSIRPE